MKIKENFLYSGLISAGVLVTSIFISIVPCRISPNVPSPIYKWITCSLNAKQISSLMSIKEYYGYTKSLANAYIITFVMTFLVVFTFLHFVTKTKTKK